jgi:hypothetical protein
MAGRAEERDYLARAAEAYRQSLTLYAKAAAFAGVPATIGLAQRSLNQVERRLAELFPAAGESGSSPDASADRHSSAVVAEVTPWA